MRFSIFEDDGTLGLDNARVVVLRGTTTVSQLFSPNLFPINDWLKTALRNAGFEVVAVRSSAAAWLGYGINIEIECNVFNNFTAEQARQNAVVAIEAYTANFGLNRVFSNTALAIAYDAFVPPATSTGGSTRPPQTSPPSSYNQTGGQPAGGFLDNLGYGLGVSTPVALLLAVGVGLVILKR